VGLPVVPLRGAAALFLARQHLLRPRAERFTPARLARFVQDTGGLQLDSINVVERAHYLTVWSRFGPYPRAALDDLVYARRALIEYWAHAACLVPASALPWWRRAMLDYRTRHTGWSTWLRRNGRVLAAVTAAVRAGGPMANADFAGRRPPARRSGWWNWKPVQHALHHLWMTGVLLIDSRRHFQKRFDLAERVVPEMPEAVSAEAFRRWHVERSLHAMGAATETDLGRYLTYPRFAPGARRRTLRAMEAGGEVVEIEVEGLPGRWLALARDLPALRRAGRAAAPSQGTTLLAPFDSLLWHRERVARLLGFHYRIEVYTPGPQRVHGYYTLPILHHGQLIGRVDAKNHRGERRLEVRHVHFEGWFGRAAPPPAASWGRLDRDEGLAGVAGAVASLAAFVGADRVDLGRVSPARLRPALQRAVGAVPVTTRAPGAGAPRERALRGRAALP
jgi:uncharacterized protein YcaQ